MQTTEDNSITYEASEGVIVANLEQARSSVSETKIAFHTEISFHFDVACACGESLSGDFFSFHGGSGTTLEVGECPKCKDNNYNEGHKDGYEEGFSCGKDEAEEKYDEDMIVWSKVKDTITR